MSNFRRLCFFLVLPTILILSSVLLYNEIELIDIIELEASTGALCLDGSPYQFYLKRNTNSKDFIFFFDGGGWCSDKVYKNTLESCVKRTNTYLGSSNYFINRIYSLFGKYPNLKRWNYFLSNDKESNPDFFHYNKIILKYCDGRGFAGFNNQPIIYEGTALYFRGFNNTIEVLNYAKQNLNLLEADSLILSGMSAGGLASLIYSNYFREILPKSIKIKAISDSGVFFDFKHVEKTRNYSFSSIWKNILRDTNPEFPDNFIQSYCKYQTPELWKCFLPEHFVQWLNIPVFIILSLYDSYSIYTFVGDECQFNSTSFCFPNEVELYRARVVDFYRKFIENREDWGGFFPGCFLHDYLSFSVDWDNNKAQVAGKTLREAVGIWKKNEKVGLLHVGEGIDEKCKGYVGLFYYMVYSGILMDIF